MTRHRTYGLRLTPALYLLWWFCWTITQTIVLHEMHVNWADAAADAVLFTVVLALCACGVSYTLRYYQPGPASQYFLPLLAAGISALFAAVFYYSAEVVFEGENHLEFVRASMPVRVAVVILVIVFQFVLHWMNAQIEEQEAVSKNRREMQDLAREAELAKLRQQLQPHFLFNSLNSISALAGSNPSQARHMIQQLSDFLRGTLKKDENKSVLLEEEIRHLNLYLEIERVRFGHRLQVEIKIDEGCYQLKVPPLLLQPVLENAIKHGLYGTTGEVKIMVHCACSNGMLDIQVINPFDPANTSSSKGSGFGLTLLGRRLQLLYGRNDLLTISKDEHNFETRIKVPQ